MDSTVFCQTDTRLGNETGKPGNETGRPGNETGRPGNEDSLLSVRYSTSTL